MMSLHRLTDTTTYNRPKTPESIETWLYNLGIPRETANAYSHKFAEMGIDTLPMLKEYIEERRTNDIFLQDLPRFHRKTILRHLKKL